MYKLDFATPNSIKIDSNVDNIPVTDWEEYIKELLYDIQAFGGKHLEKIAVLEVIQSKLGIKKFSKITRGLGWARKEINKFFLRLQGSMCVPRGVEQIATNQQLEKLAKFDSEKIIDYVESVTNQAELDTAIRKYTKEVVEPNKPPKVPKPAIGWQNKQGGGREAVCRFQDTKNTRAFMAGWEEVKAIMTADDYLASAAWVDRWAEEVKSVDEVDCVVNDTDTVDIPVTTETVDEVAVVEEIPEPPVEELLVEPVSITPPQPIEKRPLPVNKDRWKLGWEVGMRCLPKHDVNQGIHYEWTNGEFPLIVGVAGEVGTIQILTLQRSDGETIQSYGNWVDDEPILPNDIVYQRRLRDCRIWLKKLIEAKSAKNDPDIMTARLNFTGHFKPKFLDFAKDNPEYGEAVYTEIAKLEAQDKFQLR